MRRRVRGKGESLERRIVQGKQEVHLRLKDGLEREGKAGCSSVQVLSTGGER